MGNRIWNFAEFEFRETSLELRRDGVSIQAETKAREVLRCLLHNAERPVVNPADIKKAVWGDIHVSDSSVNVAVNKIRDAFNDENRERIIRTQRGSGYAWAVEVTETSRPPAPVELSVGEPVPGRPGWLLTQRLYTDEHRAVWLTRETAGEGRHVVQLARTETGLALMRAEAETHAALHALPRAADFFSSVLRTSFDAASPMLETEYLGPSLPLWVAQQGGLSAVSESLRVAIVAATATAVDLLHRAGHLHGSLSADCIHLLRHDDDWLIRIDGFGHYHADRGSHLVCPLPGTPRPQPGIFRAPELREQEFATTEGDLYALGVLLYQCIACNLAEPPVLGWEQRVLDPVLRTDITETAHIDPALRTRKPAELAKDLSALSTRRLHEEQLAQSREAQILAEQRLALELAKRPLRVALIAAMVLVSLALGTAGAIQIHALRQERGRARAEKTEQQALQTFLERLFFDGDATLQGPITPDTLTERGLQMSRTLQSSPGIHSAVLNTLGGGFTVLGRFDKAQQVLDAALAERRRTKGASSPEFAETLLQMAALKDSEGDAGAALQLAHQALAIETKTLPPDDISLARTQTQVAEDLTDLGNYKDAASLLQASVAREQGHPELLADLSTALNDLGIVENYRENLQTSLGYQEQSLDIDKVMFGARHPDIAEHLLSMSNGHMLLGQPLEAAAEAQQALSILREALPAGHHEIAAAQVILGQALIHVPERGAEAETQLQSALDVLRRESVPSRAKANALLGMASIERAQRRYPLAIASDREALALYEALYPKGNSVLTVPLCALSELYIETGAWKLARPFTQQALNLARATLKPGDQRMLEVEVLLAKMRLHDSDATQARSLVEGVLNGAPEGELRTREVRQSALRVLRSLPPEASHPPESETQGSGQN
ncbi:tetratricopeptide repeat protein [Acidipila sp. EB88]|uniref:tetratricopeptide repeat protein n=1 Tax=Acidipila sp. EB88 TaxID=2305226 RepID=UPI000F600234|nr:tetratricopeptide repeat protein [Acidipila sp. EB88]RRA47886.1 hypothetical protein D1Y84_05825 [Acidipila sp. EB88]